jgi:hypothetical protein
MFFSLVFLFFSLEGGQVLEHISGKEAKAQSEGGRGK